MKIVARSDLHLDISLARVMVQEGHYLYDRNEVTPMGMLPLASIVA